MGETVQVLVAQIGGGGGPGILQIVLFMVPFLGIMWFLMIRPERKKQAEAQALLGSLKKGDEVALTSGIIGKILSVDDKTLMIEIADKTKIKVLKQAVMGPAARWLALPPSTPAASTPAAVSDDSGDKSGDKKSA